MTESGRANQDVVQTAFVDHVRQFHRSLPRAEQELLEQILNLALTAGGDECDVQGFMEMQSLLRALLVATTLVLPSLVAHPSAVLADGPSSTTILSSSPMRAPATEQPTLTSSGGPPPGVSTTARESDTVGELIRPDLDLLEIEGPSTLGTGETATYTADIRNDGAAANGNVAITIGFSGGLQVGDGVVQSIGLSCGPGPLPATLACRGGSLAAGQQATLQFHAHAASVGLGTITVSLSLAGISEGDLNNNNASFEVTVS
jgi:hypothetical protein